MVPNDRVTLGTNVDPDLAEKVELLADAEGKSKSDWLRDQIESGVDEGSDDLDDSDLLRVLLSRQEDTDDVEIERDDDGSIRLPDPAGALEKLTNGAVTDPFFGDER